MVLVILSNQFGLKFLLWIKKVSSGDIKIATRRTKLQKLGDVFIKEFDIDVYTVNSKFKKILA